MILHSALSLQQFSTSIRQEIYGDQTVLNLLFPIVARDMDVD